MAMNLVEQQKVLRDLTDDMLQQAMQGGMAPPYMVLAEINRRKDARERYMAQKAKYDANQATVAQDIMQQMAKATQAAQAPAPTMGGLDSAMGAPMGMEPPVSGGLDAAAPAFADGGMVQKFQSGGMSLGNPAIMQSLMGGAPATGGMSLGNPAMMSKLFSSVKNDVKPFQFNYPTYQNPYSSLIDLYTSQIEGLDKERENARAMALIAAGTGMMQGGQNTLKNIGAAFGPALSGYQEQINNLSQTERDLMGGRVNAEVLGKQAEKDAKASYEDSPEGRAEVAKQMGLEPGSDDYNNYVYLKTNPVLKDKYSKDGFQQGVDANNNPVDAIYNETKQQWEMAGGIPVNGFRTYRPDEVASMKNNPKAREAFEKATTSLGNYISEHDFKMSKIDEAERLLASNPNVAGWGALMSGVPASQQAEFDALLNSILSQQAFDTITALKASGGGSTGLGPVAVPEFQALREAVTALRKTTDPKAVKEQLEKIRYNYQRAKDEMLKAYTAVNKKRVEQLPEDDAMRQYVDTYGLLVDITAPTPRASGTTGGTTLADPLRPLD